MKEAMQKYMSLQLIIIFSLLLELSHQSGGRVEGHSVSSGDASKDNIMSGSGVSSYNDTNGVAVKNDYMIVFVVIPLLLCAVLYLCLSEQENKNKLR